MRANNKNGIAAQIYALRSRAGVTQSEFARNCRMGQARISVLENGTFENITIDTLERIAEAEDVGLMVKFVPFSEIAEWVSEFDDEKLLPHSYAKDSISRSSINYGGASFVAVEQIYATPSGVSMGHSQLPSRLNPSSHPETGSSNTHHPPVMQLRKQQYNKNLAAIYGLHAAPPVNGNGKALNSTLSKLTKVIETNDFALYH